MDSQPTMVAVPLLGERVCGHFGHPECFSLVSVDAASGRILDEKRITPPPHEPGRLPTWLSEQGANVVLAGGIGARAVDLLEHWGIEVYSGVPPLTTTEAVRRWLEGDLETVGNPCGHDVSGHRCGDHS